MMSFIQSYQISKKNYDIMNPAYKEAKRSVNGEKDCNEKDKTFRAVFSFFDRGIIGSFL